MQKVNKAIAAWHHAIAINRPLNLTIDIHWKWTRFKNRNRRYAVAELLDVVRDWLWYRACGWYFVAVREDPPGEYGLTTNDEHFHLILHVPPSHTEGLLRCVRDFLRGHRRDHKKDLHKSKAMHWSSVYSEGKLGYMMKGCVPAAHSTLTKFAGNKVSEHFAFQGTIGGKRVFISESLGSRAIADHAARNEPEITLRRA